MSSTWLSCPECEVMIPVEESQGGPLRHCPACSASLAAAAATPAESQWFFAQDRQKTGPVSWGQLRQVVDAGGLRPTAMVLRSGSKKWVPAASLPGLFPALTAVVDETTVLPKAPRNDPVAQGPLPVAGVDRPAVDAPLPTVTGYEILGELGRGGMGVVYKARQTGLNRIVALKMILAGAHAGAHDRARFRAEAEAVARLQHPNIVQIYEVGEQEGRPFFSLEYVDGGSLDRKLAGVPLPPREAARQTQILARAIHCAHQAGIIHRDLKPANVLLTRDGQPKIADFGLAKQLDSAGGETRSGAILGTPGYVAPEQAAGNTSDLGPATDVYAVGVILYEMLTGAPPFHAETPLATLLQVMSQEPAPPTRLRPDVPRDLETICLKCLSKTPAQRYATAERLAEDLGRFLEGEPIWARPAGAVERTWRWCRRYPIPAALLVLVSLLLIVVTVASAFGLYHLSMLSQTLVQSTALEGAAQETELLDEVNNFYSSQVVERVKPFGIEVTNDYLKKQGSIPLPATLTIDLGNHISKQSQRGMEVRLYSDYPFKKRDNGGPHDSFEWEAMGRLRQNPNEPVYKFEDNDGKPRLRYATARVMKQSCVNCHNTHPDSTKKDWKAGDVRGVVEIIRPLDRDEARTRRGLRTTFVLVGGISAAIFGGLAAVVIGVGLWGWLRARARA